MSHSNSGTGNFDLAAVLTSVATGRLSPVEAKSLIEAAYVPVSGPTPGDGLLSAFERLRKSVHVDELLKVSSGLVHQIAENMPGQIERLQENFTSSFPTLGFSAGTPGVEGRLSVFRTFHVGADSVVEDNQVVGSQWFGVNFSEAAEVRGNKFTAVQFSEVAVLRSTLARNTLGLARASNVTFQESRIEGNRLSRSTLADLSITASDLAKTRLLKSEIAQTVVNASRFEGCALEGTSFTECEFDGCEFEGVTFENCTFRECSFENVVITGAESALISGRNVSGRVFSGIEGLERFLEILEAPAGGVDEREGTREETGRDGDERSRDRGGKRKRKSREGREVSERPEPLTP